MTRVLMKGYGGLHYEAIRPNRVLWIETGAAGETVVVELMDTREPPTWKKTSLACTPEEAQRELRWDFSEYETQEEEG